MCQASCFILIPMVYWLGAPGRVPGTATLVLGPRPCMAPSLSRPRWYLGRSGSPSVSQTIHNHRYKDSGFYRDVTSDSTKPKPQDAPRNQNKTTRRTPQANKPRPHSEPRYSHKGSEKAGSKKARGEGHADPFANHAALPRNRRLLKRVRSTPCRTHLSIAPSGLAAKH